MSWARRKRGKYGEVEIEVLGIVMEIGVPGFRMAKEFGKGRG